MASYKYQTFDGWMKATNSYLSDILYKTYRYNTALDMSGCMNELKRIHRIFPTGDVDNVLGTPKIRYQHGDKGSIVLDFEIVVFVIVLSDDYYEDHNTANFLGFSKVF